MYQNKVHAGRVRTPILSAGTLIFAYLQDIISNLSENHISADAGESRYERWRDVCGVPGLWQAICVDWERMRIAQPLDLSSRPQGL
jgi:hypothetical protein